MLEHDYDLIGYSVMQVLDQGGNLRVGTYHLDLCEGPIYVEELDNGRKMGATVKISIGRSSSDMPQAEPDTGYKDTSSGGTIAPYIAATPLTVAEANAIKVAEEVKTPVDLAAAVSRKGRGAGKQTFIKNLKEKNQGSPDKLFVDGMGIDFYVDAARFLPSNVTVTKVVIRVVTSLVENVISPTSGFPDIGESSIYSPYFGLRYELRKSKFDKSSLVVIAIETIEKGTM